MNKALRFLEMNAPTILTGVGVVGTITTSIFSVRGHVKATEIIRAAQEEAAESPELSKVIPTKERIKKTWTCYIPAGVSGALTITAIVASNKLSLKSIAALSAAAGYLAKNRDQIKAKLIEVEDKVKEYLPKELTEQEEGEDKPDISTDNPEFDHTLGEFYKLSKYGHFPPTYEYTGNGTTRCIDLYSGRSFLSSPEAVKKAQDELNEMYENGCYVCLSDLYELYGINKTTFGFDFGWPANPDYFDGPIHFENEIAIDNDGHEVMLIDIWTPPMDCWQEV